MDNWELEMERRLEVAIRERDEARRELMTALRQRDEARAEANLLSKMYQEALSANRGLQEKIRESYTPTPTYLYIKGEAAE